MRVEVDFLAHSGFSVSVGQHYLLFDYFKGRFPGNQAKSAKYTLAFASHGHKDHFNKKIFHLTKYNPGTRYLLWYDIQDDFNNAKKMKPGDVFSEEDITVYAFGSTDTGVSFAVETEGIKIFHAGDLNFWSWRNQSTQEEVDEAEELFEREISQIPLFIKDFDIVFFPVDPRLRKDSDEGAKRLLTKIKAAHFFPMHMWGNFKAVKKIEKSIGKKTTVHIPESREQKFILDI